MGKINVEEVKNWKDILIQAGNYQVEVLKAEDKVTQYDDDYIAITFKIVDTIPSGLEIDTDNYIDAVEEQSLISTNIYFPKEADEQWKRAKANKTLQGYLANFEIDPLNDDEIVAEDFKDTVGGIYIKHGPKDWKDKNGDQTHKVQYSVPVV